MMMAEEFEVNNIDEFEEILNNKDIRVSKAITDTILTNLKGRKRHLHALSVVCKEEGEIYDISVDRKDFIHTLEIHLPNFELNEMYEECAEIVRAIEYLNSKKK